MAIEDLKITDAEFLSRSVKGLANRPVSSVGGYGRQDLTSAQLKERFDANGALLKERLNALIDALCSVSGAENIGISSRFTLNGDSVDTVAKFVAFLESDEAVEQIIYNGTQSLESVINGIKATLTEHGLNITALNNFATNAVTKVAVSANEFNKTITVSLLDNDNNIKSEATVEVPSADTSMLAKSITLYYTNEGGFVRLWYDTRNADGAMISESYIDLPIPSSASSANPLVTKANLDVVEAVAKGRATGYVFDTKADMDEALEDETFTEKLVLGDNLYIRATDTPDYWWDGTQAQMLETQKVDLSEYRKATAQDAIDAGKLDKVTSVGGARAYGIGEDGSQRTFSITTSPYSGTLVYRKTDGRTEVGTAVNDSEAVNLGQMNTSLATKTIRKIISETAETTPKGVTWWAGSTTQITGTLEASAETELTICFVPTNYTPSHDDHISGDYAEYVVVKWGNEYRWEKVGVDKSDLTDYAPKSYVDSLIGDINTALDAINGEEI